MLEAAARPRAASQISKAGNILMGHVKKMAAAMRSLRAAATGVCTARRMFFVASTPKHALAVVENARTPGMATHKRQTTTHA